MVVAIFITLLVSGFGIILSQKQQLFCILILRVKKREWRFYVQVLEAVPASDTGGADECPATFGYKVAPEVLDKIEVLIKV